MRARQSCETIGECVYSGRTQLRAKGLFCESLDDRKGVLDPVVELIDQNALVFFKGHFFCYIVALNQNAFEVVSTVDRLVDELEKPGLKFSILARIQEDPFFLAEVWFVLVEHVVEQLDEPLIDNFRQRFRHRFANQLALTDKLTIRSIRHYKSMISSTQYRYEPGCLFEQGTESIQFLAGPPITFLYRFGAPGDAFDPTLHEALSHIGEDPDVEVTTCKVIAKAGYRIGERVVRAAQVLVVDPAGS